MDGQTPAIRVRDLHEIFKIYDEVPPGIKERLTSFKRAHYKEFHALDGVSIDIMPGERVGLIGHNGSGKSTLLKCMAKIYPANRGSVEVNGRIATLLELGAGFSPELTGRENMYLNGSILGLRRAEIDASFDRIVDFAGVRDFIDHPVKNYSSGMYVRLGFAIAVHVDPDILLVDEVLAVGDQTFQERSLARMSAFAEAGKTVVLVSHDLGSIGKLCDRVVLLESGHVAFDGPAEQALEEYQRRLAGGHGTDLVVPDLPTPSAHGANAHAGADLLTHHVSIDAVDLHVGDAETDEGEGVPRVGTGAPATVEVTLTPTAQLVGQGGLYVRLMVRRPDLPMPLYDSRTSYRVQYVAPPPVGESLRCAVDLRLNVLSGTYLIDVEVGNAEDDSIHERLDAAARVVVRGEPWDVGIVPLDATFRVHNPRGVWPPDSEPPPVKDGGPASHPDPLWPTGAAAPDPPRSSQAS
ncbi:MAG TPA: polysaccharide ABC transporter ATP-binding protein [Euzebya sp.]|nr:polysaccharide ABC transporter ATP-binding protein [Euzebya sp.]